MTSINWAMFSPHGRRRILSRVTAVRLGIDFGTSHTVAFLASGDRPPVPLLFDGSPLLPSAVWADPSGRLVAGRDALHAAQADPAAFEPSPKRRIDEESLLLGSVELPVEDVIAAVFAHVAVEAARVAGRPVTSAAVTHPAAWAAPRRTRLEAAARRAFPDVTLVSEPIAAANYVVSRTDVRLPPGGTVLVYDFGAGTFDASVVRADAAGRLTVAATEGLDDTGGLDVDAAIVAHLEPLLEPETLTRLAAPATRADRRARRALWDAARTAKELLSRAPSTVIALPGGDREAPLGREELTELARPVLARTVETAVRVTATAGPPHSVFLVGGASRMPLVASLLHHALGVPPSVLDQPELVVAEGALHATGPAPTRPGGMPRPAAGDPARRGSRTLLLVAAGTVAVAITATAPLLLTSDSPLGSPGGRLGDSVAPPNLVDPCLVGTWTKVHHKIETDIGGATVEISGPALGNTVYQPDGTYTSTFHGGRPMSAEHDGATWTYQLTGEISGHFRTNDAAHVMVLSGSAATGSVVLRRDGEIAQSTSLGASDTPIDYDCAADRLILRWGAAELTLERPR
jgi:molecular chaperone DnaK